MSTRHQGREHAPALAVDALAGEAHVGLCGQHGEVLAHEQRLAAVADAREHEQVGARRGALKAALAEHERERAGSGDLLRLPLELIVEPVALVPADEDQQAEPGCDHHDHRREGGGEGDPRAQAHGRSTNPTPRTVWMTRGSSPASSLRRR